MGADARGDLPQRIGSRYVQCHRRQRLLRKRLEVHGTQHLPPVPGTDNQPNEFCDRFVHYRPEMARGAYLDEYDSHAEAVEAADRTFTPESISPSAQVEGKAALGDWISHTLVMSR